MEEEALESTEIAHKEEENAVVWLWLSELVTKKLKEERYDGRGFESEDILVVVLPPTTTKVEERTVEKRGQTASECSKVKREKGKVEKS